MSLMAVSMPSSMMFASSSLLVVLVESLVRMFFLNSSDTCALHFAQNFRDGTKNQQVFHTLTKILFWNIKV